MQFILRPAGTWLEYDALDIAEDGAVRIPNVPGLGIPFEVDGGMRLLGNDADGEAISLGSVGAPFFKGISTESSQAILNFDMNFSPDLVQAAWKRAAVRLDSRTGYPAIQFLTRPAGTINEWVAASISDTGLMSIGNISANAVLSVANTGLPTSTVANFVATYTKGAAAIVNCTATSGPTHFPSSLQLQPSGNAGNFQGPCADVLIVANTRQRSAAYTSPPALTPASGPSPIPELPASTAAPASPPVSASSARPSPPAASTTASTARLIRARMVSASFLPAAPAPAAPSPSASTTPPTPNTSTSCTTAPNLPKS